MSKKTEKVSEGMYSSWLNMPITKMVITFIQDEKDGCVESIVDAVRSQDHHAAAVALGGSYALEEVEGFITNLVADPEEGDDE